MGSTKNSRNAARNTQPLNSKRKRGIVSSGFAGEYADRRNVFNHLAQMA
jgi:hypothetical protein